MDWTLLEVHFSAMMWFIYCLSKQKLRGIFFSLIYLAKVLMTRTDISRFYFLQLSKAASDLRKKFFDDSYDDSNVRTCFCICNP